MPYTPPSKRSPTASHSNSPSLTRNPSYAVDTRPLVSPRAPNRPDLPRSRSAVYIAKHRRSPSFIDNKASQSNDVTQSAVVTANSETSRTTDASVAAENVISSPVETQNSDEDEDRGRKRQIEVLAESLKESLQLPKRQPSPKGSRGLPVTLQIAGNPVKALSAEAKKIAHSRSSSEIIQIVANALQVPTQSSDGDSDDEGLQMKRGPLLRKKSGELVKPALRASSHRRRPISAPGTPTYPKAVHFGEQIEQVRHFLQVDRPIAVSAGSSPVEIYDSETDYPFGSDNERRKQQTKAVEWEVKLTNFPQESHERKCLPVRVEQLYLTKDFKFLIGIVAVANISFEKMVAARFTLDYWKTTSEVSAEYYTNRGKFPNDGFDRFQFSIKLSDLANLQNKTMYICVRYNSSGNEHWDNNFGNNYQIDFLRKGPVKPQVQVGTSPAGIPRSRNNAHKLPRPRSFPASNADDEFSTAYSSPFRLRKSDGHFNKLDQGLSDKGQGQTANRLSNRYDFSTSLHAALTTAQNALGERSGLKIQTEPPKQQLHVVTQQPHLPRSHQQIPTRASRPDLNSLEYQDLINKFCYFGTPTKSDNFSELITSPLQQEIAKEEEIKQVDGHDSGSDSNASSANSSPSQSPPSPTYQLDPQTVEPSVESKTSSRSSSAMRGLSPRLLPFRQPSPALSGYQEFPHQGLSLQTSC
jgi:hypothetical protein